MKVLIALLVAANTTTADPICIDAKLKAHILELTLTAIDSALVAHVSKLFDVWLKDYSPEPQRAMAGMANGIQAYLRARANALKWNPEVCK